MAYEFVAPFDNPPPTTESYPEAVFDIPAPYNNSVSYMLKVIDSNNCIISGTTII